MHVDADYGMIRKETGNTGKFLQNVIIMLE